jgi:hypothetical protein
LAAELFERRFNDEVARHDDIRGLLPRLRGVAAGGPAIEVLLEQLRAEEAQYPELRPRQFLALRNYLRDVIQRVSTRWLQPEPTTNLDDLVGRIAEWCIRSNESVTYVTFNYDLLLDRAIEAVYGFRLTDLQSYVAAASVKLIKVHGSVNWSRAVSNVPIGATPLQVAAQLRWSSQYYTTLPAPANVAPDVAFVPAIAVPTITKSGFECPVDHVQALETAMDGVSKLLVIGWRAAEEYFFERWRAVVSGTSGGPTPIGPRALQWTYVIDRDQVAAQEVAATIYGRHIRAGRDAGFAGGFSDFLTVRGELERLLDSQ